MIKCGICGEEKPWSKLGIHVFNKHHINSFEYAIKYLEHSINPPMCKCGCGKKVGKWNGMENGWKEFIHGHNKPRLGKTVTMNARKKISDMLKKRYLSGEIINPRKGKSKENDISLKSVSLK